MLVSIGMLCLSGCYHGYVVAPVRAGPERTELGISWLWGLTSTRTNAVECKYGLAMAGSYYPWWGFLLSGITAGIVNPVEKSYACAEEPPPTPYPPYPYGYGQPPPMQPQPPPPGASGYPAAPAPAPAPQAVVPPPPRCVASELPEWNGASAERKRELLEYCRGP